MMCLGMRTPGHNMRLSHLKYKYVPEPVNFVPIARLETATHRTHHGVQRAPITQSSHQTSI